MKRTAFKKKPSWSYCTADWINEIKIRTSWTNEKLAGELGVSLSTLHNIKSAPWKVSGAYVLRLLEIRNNVIVRPAGVAGGVWNPIGNTRAKIIRRKRGSVMRRELKCMELRSQNQRIIEVLGEELSRAQADLQFAWRLAFTGLAIAAVATGAMVAIAQAAGMF